MKSLIKTGICALTLAITSSSYGATNVTSKIIELNPNYSTTKGTRVRMKVRLYEKGAYQVQTSSNLVNWVNGESVVTNPVNAIAQFYLTEPLPSRESMNYRLTKKAQPSMAAFYRRIK
jgi:hypothetical protein